MCGGFFCLSGLALSVKACRLCQLSQRESPWHNGKVSGIVQRRPLGGAGERSEPEGVASALPKAALQMSSPSTTPPVKMGYRNARRRSDIPKFKIIFPLKMAKAQRKPFKIVHSAKKGCCTHGAAAFLRFADVRGRSYFWGASKAMAVAPAAASTLFREMGATS